MQFLTILGYIFGAIFLCACIALVVINVVGIVKDIKKKRRKELDKLDNDRRIN